MESIEILLDVLISMIPNDYKYNPVIIDTAHWNWETNIDIKLYDEDMRHAIRTGLDNLFNNSLIKSYKFGLINESN